MNPYRGDCYGNESGHYEGDTSRCAHTPFYDQFVVCPASLDPISACKKCTDFFSHRLATPACLCICFNIAVWPHICKERSCKMLLMIGEFKVLLTITHVVFQLTPLMEISDTSPSSLLAASSFGMLFSSSAVAFRITCSSDWQCGHGILTSVILGEYLNTVGMRFHAHVGIR